MLLVVLLDYTVALATPISNHLLLRAPSISHTTPTSPLTIRITDTDGKDLSQHNITIHLHQSLVYPRSTSPQTSRQTSQKRALPSTPQCDPGWETRDSFCTPHISLQVYHLLCYKANNLPGNRYHIVSGACLPDETCFQRSIQTGTQPSGRMHRAYCISQGDLTPFAATSLSKPVGTS